MSFRVLARTLETVGGVRSSAREEPQLRALGISGEPLERMLTLLRETLTRVHDEETGQ